MKRYTGNLVLELEDVNTGTVETVSETNMVTNAVNDILGVNPMGVMYKAGGQYDDSLTWNDELLPICPNMIGGILLFPSSITEQADNLYLPSTNLPVAYASNDVNATANTKRGSMNLTESMKLSNGYKFVWEFTPSQGNGTIAAVGLTSKHGGANAYGSDVAVDSTLLQIKKVSLDDEDGFINDLYRTVTVDFTNERKCSASTRNSRLAAITKFSEYAQNRDIDAASCFRTACAKLPYKKLSDAKERSYFTQVEIKIFLALPNIKDKTGYRDQIVLCILYASGMRAEEICALTVGDVSFLPDGKASILIHGKGGKSRRIKISEKPSAMLKKYISYRRISNQHERHIFSTQRNEMMSTSALEELFSKYVKRAKEQNEGLFLEETYTPHSMRHTTAVHMVEAGVPLLVIKQFLGHAHLSTTEIYAKMSQSTVNEKLKGWDEEYWHDQYIDSLEENSTSETTQNNTPDFLK